MLTDIPLSARPFQPGPFRPLLFRRQSGAIIISDIRSGNLAQRLLLVPGRVKRDIGSFLASPNRSLYPWLLAIVATAAVVAALIVWAIPSSPPGVEVVLPPPTPAPELKVFVSGAVARPGVYQLQEGDRLVDALVAAGGPTVEADLMVVNQALRVRDEDHLHIPRIGEAPTPTPPDSARPTAGVLNINEAGIDALQELPNIGAARANAIVTYRQQNGGFDNPAEIMEVEGIGPGIFESLRELIEAR